MTNNHPPTEEPDGVRWLRMLGREDLIGTQQTLADGREILAEEFPDVSPKGAVALRGFDSLAADDPRRPLFAEQIGQMLEYYFGPKPPEQA